MSDPNAHPHADTPWRTRLQQRDLATFAALPLPARELELNRRSASWHRAEEAQGNKRWTWADATVSALASLITQFPVDTRDSTPEYAEHLNRLRRGHCPECNYELGPRSHAECAACPECGFPYPFLLPDPAASPDHNP